MGCDPCKNTATNADPRYMMVQTTASSADPCGDSSTPVTSTSACAKQEPEFDLIESDFVLPSQGNTITVNVCNNAVYAVNQYIEFTNYGVIMRIVTKSASGKQMTLMNSCRNGGEIGNPDAGIGISSGSTFSVIGEPPCLTSEEEEEELNNALATATEICTPALTEAPIDDEDDVIQVVGRRESAADLGFQKCIRRIEGIFAKLGAFFLPDIRTVDQSDQVNYSMVGVDRASGQMKKMREVRDFSTTGANAKYIFGGSSTVTRLPVGPAFVFSPFSKVLEEKNTLTNFATYTTIAAAATYSKDFSVAIPEITGLVNKDLQDHYYLLVHVLLAVQENSGGGVGYLEVLLNDVVYDASIRNSGGVMYSHALTIPIKIMNSDVNFNLKLRCTGNQFKYYYKVMVLGAYI